MTNAPPFPSELAASPLDDGGAQPSWDRIKLKVLADAAGFLLLADNPRNAVESLIEQMAPLLGIDVCFHYVVDEGHPRLRLAFFRGVPPEIAEALTSLEFDHPFCRVVIRDNRPIVLAELPDHPETALVRSLGLTAYACFPLSAYGGLLGVLGFGSRTRTGFSPHELDLLQSISYQLAASLERLRMIELLQSRNKALQAEVAERQRVEENLLKSQRELRDFLENGALGLHWVGPDGTILWANQAELDMLGYSRPEYVGRHIAEFHADKKIIADILERLWRGEILHEVEARLICKDGSVKDVLIDSSVYWENGEFVHTRCFTRDITERKKAERALRESESRMRSILDALPAAAYVCDAQGRIIYFNRLAVEAWGRTPKMNDLSERFCGSWKLFSTSGELVPHDQCWVALSLRENRPYTGKEVVIERPDGSRMTALAHIEPFHDESGRVLGAINVVVDITERKNAEEALRVSQKMFSLVFDKAPFAIALTRLRDRVFSDVNEAWVKVSGYKKEEVIGKTTAELALTSDEELRERAAARLKSGDSLRGLEIPLNLRTGRRIFSVNSDPIELSGERYALTTLEDITERKRAEIALRESEERFRGIFESAAVGIALAGPDGKFLDENKKFLEILGYSSEELKTMTPLDITHPDDRAITRESMRRVLSGEIPNYTYEKRYITKDGRTLWSLTTVTLMRDSQGKPMRFIGVIEDITDRKRAEELLALREAQLQLITATTPAMLTQCSRDFRYLYANKAYADMLGLLPEQIIGRPIPEVIGQEGYESILPHIRRVLNGELVDYEQEVPLKTGRRWLRVSYRPNRNPAGEVTGWVASIRDVTERKKSEIERSRLAAIVESSADSIVATTLDGTVTAWNQSAERLFGYTADEMIGRPITTIFPADRLHEETMFLEKVKRGERINLYETVRQHKDGRVLDVSLSVAPVRDDTGQIVGVSKIARDITERKKAEEALRVLNNQLESMVGERTRDLAAANRELEAFCYSVAHDLRSPLRGIDGFSQVLLKACEDRLSDPEKDYIKRIRTASQRMAGLIDGLLELARLARMELRFADVDMSGIAAAILEELRRTYPDRVVETRVARGLRVKADERLVRALLFNLLENAWKFTEKRSPARIEFGVMKEENISAFFVRDDGAGFDMAYVDKLFKPFERLHGAEFPGTGIGLATVQRIVQRHGGRVWAEGVVEKGAAFYFTLGDKNVPRTKRK